MPVEEGGGGRKLEGLGLWRYGRWMRRFCVDGRLARFPRMAAQRGTNEEEKKKMEEREEAGCNEW